MTSYAGFPKLKKVHGTFDGNQNNGDNGYAFDRKLPALQCVGGLAVMHCENCGCVKSNRCEVTWGPCADTMFERIDATKFCRPWPDTTAGDVELYGCQQDYRAIRQLPGHTVQMARTSLCGSRGLSSKVCDGVPQTKLALVLIGLRRCPLRAAYHRPSDAPIGWVPIGGDPSRGATQQHSKTACTNGRNPTKPCSNRAQTSRLLRRPFPR